MRNGPYIDEHQSAYWLSRQIEKFFSDLGFEILTLPIHAFSETDLPSDFIFFDKRLSKLFGFQYKALYANAEDYWKLEGKQHTNLCNFPWMYYCLSEQKQAREHKITLHLARIISADFKFKEKLFAHGPNRLSFYERWGSFYQELIKCLRGIVVDSPEHLRQLILQNKDNANLKRLTESAVDMFLADLDSKNIIHYSPFLENEHEI